MSTLFLLDTNVVSYFLRRASPVLEQRVSHALRAQNCAISVLTRAELRFGQCGMEPGDKRRALIDAFLLRLPCLPWGQEAADRYGVLKDNLRRAGTPIGELDTQIAAHALADGLTLVTHNTRHFVQVQGLRLEDWMVG
ncbi:MAG: type II toxin-antitoxin system VapC family toxin [Acidovorax sp.]|uniref:type II toxin-antitoxin system VapC family toxin n=1 Tax=Acidovorax sp. TaxID=1872122 RepID=UPI0039E665CA